MLAEAESFTSYLDSVKDPQDSDIAEKLGEHFDAMIANKKLKAKAVAVVSEMLGVDSKNGSESVVNNELADVFIALAENRTMAMGRREDKDLTRTMNQILE